MLNLSYTVTPKLNVLLKNIDRTREKILLLNLERRYEMQLAWRAKIARCYFSLTMSGNKLKRREMASILSSFTSEHKQKFSKEESEVISYFQAQNYINYEWYLNKNSLKPANIYELYKISSESTFGNSLESFNKNSSLMKQLLDYIAQGDEHPVIKAGIVQMQIRRISPFINANGRITRLASQLYIYKNGYDVRGLLVLDEYWKRNINRYRQEVTVADKSENMTGWLEFFAEAFDAQIEKALNSARMEVKVPGIKKSFWLINKRQKQILSLLENPNIKLSNDDVQKRFKVSQITASRDLAKLYKLDLIFRHGGGRSVYYTRV